MLSHKRAALPRQRPRTKVAVVSEIPTPYRDPVFERMMDLEDLDVHVLYCAPTESGRNWSLEKKYPHKILPGIRFTPPGKNPHAVKVNPAIWGILSRGNYEAVVLASYTQPTMQIAMAWCRKNKIPYILWSESHHLTPRSGLKKLLKEPLVRFWVKGAAAYLALGTNARDYLISYGASPDGIFRFPNAPDVERLAREAEKHRRERRRLQAALGLSGDPIVLYVGRLIGVKNLKILLEAFGRAQKEVPKAGLVLVGDGPERSRLESTARDLGLSNLFFAGFVDPRDTVKYYSSGDILVLGSTSETWGATVGEGMACGLPVVVSDKVGCARDLVEGKGTGFVVAPEDADGWAKVLLDLMKNEPLRRKMGTRAREVSMNSNYEFCISQFRQAVAKALEPANRNPVPPLSKLK